MQSGLESMTLLHNTRATTDNILSIASRIAACAHRTPNQIAIADELHSYTFAELERRSNQLAWELVAHGLKADDCVGLFYDRSCDFIVAALAVLKSGAAYLALDSNTPADRAAVMLADAGAPLVLTHRRKTHEWANGSWSVIETDAIDLSYAPSEPVHIQTSPENLAYVVYTSGSTGQPKGVEITHANLLNLIEWHQSAFCVSNVDRASQVAGLGFDALAWEVWPHLTAGASVHIADDLTRRSPQALRDWLVANKITISFVPTVLAEQLMHSDWPAETALRKLLTGADTLHRRPSAGLPFVVVNNYGPSECTVVATSGVVNADADASSPPSIGCPIANATVLLLNEQLQPVAAGEAGELCIAGELVGRGYRNRPELTAERFVNYTPVDGPSVRIYRTGDRARWLPSGELAFLGRLDDQLKIRGYRIEPGEIVAMLDRIPGIEASAVAAFPSDTGPALAAYVVLRGGADLTAIDLREFLAQRLPDYMIPAQFVKLDSLPLTANGKLDKAALPTPTADNLLPNRVSDAAVVDQATGLQAQLGELVATLLGQPSVEPNDNFFTLGGHSMLAAQLVARINDVFGVRITLRQLFKAPTVAALAAELTRAQETKRD